MMQARTLSAALAQFQTALRQTKTNFQETALLRMTVERNAKNGSTCLPRTGQGTAAGPVNLRDQ